MFLRKFVWFTVFFLAVAVLIVTSVVVAWLIQRADLATLAVGGIFGMIILVELALNEYSKIRMAVQDEQSEAKSEEIACVIKEVFEEKQETQPAAEKLEPIASQNVPQEKCEWSVFDAPAYVRLGRAF